jgi:hypothetical protein
MIARECDAEWKAARAQCRKEREGAPREGRFHIERGADCYAVARFIRGPLRAWPSDVIVWLAAIKVGGPFFGEE